MVLKHYTITSNNTQVNYKNKSIFLSNIGIYIKKNTKKSNNKKLYYKVFKYKYYGLNVKNKPEIIKGKKLP